MTSFLSAGPSARLNIVSFNPQPREFARHNFACESRTTAAPDHPGRYDEIELHLIRSGSQVYLFGGEEIVFEPGRLAVFWAASPHQIVKSANPPEHFIIKIPLTWFLQCGFPPRLVRAILHGRVVMEPLPDSRADTKQFDRWVADIESRDSAGRRIVQLELEARLLRLAMSLPEQPDLRQAGDVASAPLGGGQVNRVGDMVAFIAQNYTRPITVELVSKSVGLHPHYAMNLFRRTLGTTLINCVTHHRIAHAQRLLITTDKKIIDVALIVGFNSISRFNAAFRDSCNCSPREYRDIHQGANREFTFPGQTAN